MVKFSAKFKIILIIFTVIVLLYFFHFIISAFSNSSKKEAFENSDDSPNEKKKNDKVVDKEVKLTILEKVEDVMNKLYPNSEKKPIMFDMLTKKEHFDELKEKHVKGEGMERYIKNFVKKTMANIEGEKEKDDNESEIDEKVEKYSDENPNEKSTTEKPSQEKPKPKKTKEEEHDEMMDRPLKSAISKLDKEDRRVKLMSDLEVVVAKISEIQNEIRELDKIIDEDKVVSEKAIPLEKPSDKPNEKQNTIIKKPVQEDFIEGFENRINYALY